MPESLIAAVERLGHAVEHGADRGAAIRELCRMPGSGLNGPAAGTLLDDWRNMRRRYDVLAGATRHELDALWAVVQAARAQEQDRNG